VRLSDGTIVKGANQENAAYPSGLCAERTAMFAAGANYPGLDLLSIAIVARQDGRICSSPAAPCGACRQVMAQYQTRSGKPMSIILVGSERIMKFARVDDLLPLIFDNI
jgi:cytidine deaminase